MPEAATLPIHNTKIPKTGFLQLLTVITLSVFAFIFSLWAIHVGWKNSITNDYSFRQCQTAISARSIQEGGPLFPYETPVLGPPWTVPFEFPLYQALAGWTARLTPLPLERAGRLISVFLFYATLWPSWCCLAFLGVKKNERIFVLALIALSPFYIFWSRAFLMESTALFFSVTYLALVLWAIARKRRRFSAWLLIAIALAGSLAGSVKVTTYASFLLAGAFAILLHLWRERPSRGEWAGPALLIIAACIVPFLLTTAWTHYTDIVKSHSPMTDALSSKALVSWNFGTLQQRLQLANYLHLMPVIDSIIGNKAIFGLIFLGIILVPGRRKHVLASLFFWSTGFLIFFNLHYQHSYYAYANGIFLVVALGFVIVGLYERDGEWRWLAAFVLAFCIGTFVSRYFLDFYVLQRINYPATRPVAQVLMRVTQPEDVLLVYGLDWSSELPYLAHRRAIMDRYGLVHRPEVDFALSHLPPRRLGAIVVCGPTTNYPELIHPVLTSLSFETTAYTNVSECEIYLPRK